MGLSWLRWIGALCACAGLMTPIAAASATPLLSQYEHTAWRKQDGAVQNPLDITQTQDGALWVGTGAGLFRFDGVRFDARNQFDAVSIAQWRVDAVHGARDGSLWLGTFGHVGHVVNGHLRQYTVAGDVNTFAEDKDGAIWFTLSHVVGSQGPLCSVTNDVLRCFGKPGIPYANLLPLSVEPDGSLWLGSDEGLCHWSPLWAPGRQADCALHEMLGPSYGMMGVTSIVRASKTGVQWLGIARSGHRSGLGRLVDGKWTPLVTSSVDGNSLDVNVLLEDADGTLWIGTNDNGIYRVQANRVDHFDRDDGLTDNAIYNLFEDSEGTVWATTEGGLDAFRKLPVSVFSRRQGLPTASISAVLPARDGGVWISSHPLTLLKQDKPVAPSLPAFLHGKKTASLLEDHQGRLWVGAEGDLVVLEAGVLHRVADVDGRPTGSVQTLVEDASHDVWALTTDPGKGLLRIRDFVYQETWHGHAPRIVAADPAGGLWLAFADKSFGRFHGEQVDAGSSDHIASGRVRSLRAEADGTLFVSTSEGLLIKRGPLRRWLDVDHGLPCDAVLSVIRDAKRDAWLLLECGIMHVEAADLEAWLAQPGSRIRHRLFDASDGFQPGFSGFLPRASLAPDGRLWFGTDKVAQVIDPAMPIAAHKPPPIRIDEILADRVAYQAGSPLRLPQRTRDIEIRYAALSFVVPRKIRFRYRLEGRDKDWTDAGTRREVFYTDLPPGVYRFHVTACNSDGVWNETGASLDFEIAPAFFQTGWFLALCIALAAGLPCIAYLVRARQLAARYQDRLATQNAERERIARDLHDTLLQGTQGLVLSFQAVAAEYAESDPRRQHIEALLDHADHVIAQTRDEVLSLRAGTCEQGDLFERLAALGDGLARDGSEAFTPSLSGTVRALESSVADEAYMLAREALLNAFRHAKAHRITLVLEFDPAGLRLTVRDDGVGLDAQTLANGGRSGHWGLTGMQERARRIGATLSLCSKPGMGMEVVLHVPAAAAYAPASRGRASWRGRWRAGMARALVARGA